MTVLGIDTSNYTTSVAYVFSDGFRHAREILNVDAGERGLRQSDALFLHTKNLPRLFEKLGKSDIDAVAFSEKPRDVEGSYMPCFLAGESVARSLAAALGVPVFAFSHQAGHIEAAVRTCGEEIGDEFLAFHLSGGTTELLLTKKDGERGWLCEVVGKTLDISAGQLIDRAGVLLGMKFPCGAELEEAAVRCVDKMPKINIKLQGGSCNLSGFENKILEMVGIGVSREYISRYALEAVGKTVIEMSRAAREKYPSLPIVYAGGVMRNSIIKEMIKKELKNVCFAAPELSSDNAVGTAYLGYRRLSEEKNGR